MTDLRKAAEMALDALDMYREHDAKNIGLADAAYEALRQALAQPEWVGLTDEEIEQCFVFDWSGEFYANWRKQTYEAIKAKLKEKK